jgi:hypothetical protein
MPSRIPLRRCLKAFTVSISLAAVSVVQGEERRLSFNRDVRPILSNKCFLCHGPDEKNRKADLRLDNREGATTDLGGYKAITPGNPDESELVNRVSSTDSKEVMPPPKSKKGRLSQKEIATLRQWIKQGAEYEGHWSFLPLSEAAPPSRRRMAGQITKSINSYSPGWRARTSSLRLRRIGPHCSGASRSISPVCSRLLKR